MGTPAVYAAGALSLAVLELLVHLHIEQARKRYAVLVLEWPDAVGSDHLRLDEIPQRWRAGEIPSETQLLGRVNNHFSHSRIHPQVTMAAK